MTARKIIIIDDDEKLGSVLKEYLEKNGYVVDHYLDPVSGIDEIKKNLPDFVILDIMLPGINGLEVCRNIRSFSNLPILFLSARGETTDKIVGLEVGGDDYLGKPFEPRELLARIESVLRRAKDINVKNYNGLELFQDKLIAKLNGKDLDLTSNEFQALHFLIQNKDRIVTRDMFLTMLQGMDSEVYGRSIDILISRIRQKLKDDSKVPLFIKTIRGQGYRFVGEK